MFDLEVTGHDAFSGHGPPSPWGALYGGQIVAQALAAAARTVEERFVAHSLRAYFIRRGDQHEPIGFAVDRIRDGRSFVTRRVVATQQVGAILNLEASFQIDEPSPDVQTITAPVVPAPDELDNDSWSPLFDRRLVPPARLPDDSRDGSGRTISWVRAIQPVGDLADPSVALLHQCWAAYFSDDTPIDAIVAMFEGPGIPAPEERYMATSLDHAIWFHAPYRIDEWHLVDVSVVRYGGRRGLTVGYVFTADGRHVMTCTQEGLVRERVGRTA